jgi:hypothetical protein
MTTFRPIILKCPQCGTLMSDFELMSFTVHHAVSWSDGKNDNGIPDEREIKICAVCHLPFWKREATLPHDPDWDVGDELGGALDIRDQMEPFDDGWQEFKIQFYSNLISEDFAGDDDQEIYLRTRLWWAINDLIRYHTGFGKPKSLQPLTDRIKQYKKRRQEADKRLKLFNSFHQMFGHNLDRLIFLTIKNGDVDLLYLADMYREKGDFEKAMDILGKYEGEEKSIYQAMKREIRRKNGKVFPLS